MTAIFHGIADAVGQGDWENTATYSEGSEKIKEATVGIGQPVDPGVTAEPGKRE